MKTPQTTKGQSEEPEIYRNGEGNPVIFANKAQAIRKALELGGDWSVHQSPESRRFYVRKLAASVEPESARDMDEHDPLLAAYNDGDGDQRTQHSALPYSLETINAKLAYFSPEERALIVRSVNNAKKLAEALERCRDLLIAYRRAYATSFSPDADDTIKSAYQVLQDFGVPNAQKGGQ